MNLGRVIFVLILSTLFIIGCTDKLSEDEYYKFATENFNKQRYQKSIDNFKKIVEHYPDGKRGSEALFMLGYINANYTKNLERAEKYYKSFIEKYPNDELTDDAEYELKHLGKDINELPIFKDIPKDSVAEEVPSK
jgi:outer membrane protein assembly factor BamD (BamD/ComL family)